MAYANAIAGWSDVGGYDAEVLWDECTTRAFGESFDDVANRPLRTFSGGEQKRLALETLLRSEFDILVLDEPDNFLDVPAKRWLEQQLNETRKTVVFISHDRELLAATATKIVTLDAAGAWTHGGSFATYADGKGTPRRAPRAQPVALRHREATAGGLRQADASAGLDQRGVRAQAQGRRDQAPTLRREERATARRGDTEDRCPAARCTHRQTGRHLRATRDRRADRSVRSRTLVRRTRRGARRQRRRQEPLPPTARVGRHGGRTA